MSTKKTTVSMAAVLAVATVLMAVVLTGIFSKTTYADTSSTNKGVNSNQKVIASGDSNAQNCGQINIDSHTSAGDEGVDCHNSQPQSTEQTASD
jgi:archaellin